MKSPIYKPLKGFTLCVLFVCAYIFTIALIMNRPFSLPIYDNSRYVMDTQTIDGQEIAFDAEGNVVENWPQNNYLDDIIKGLAVALTGFIYWLFLGVFISDRELRIGPFILSIPVFVALAFIGLLLFVPIT